MSPLNMQRSACKIKSCYADVCHNTFQTAKGTHAQQDYIGRRGVNTNDLQQPSRSLHLRGKFRCAVLCSIWGAAEGGWFPGGASCIGILVVLSMEVFKQLGCTTNKMIVLRETGKHYLQADVQMYAHARWRTSSYADGSIELSESAWRGLFLPRHYECSAVLDSSTGDTGSAAGEFAV